MELPPLIKDFLKAKQFTTEKIEKHSRFLLIKGRLPKYKQFIVFKIEAIKKPSTTLRQKNLMIWTRSLQNKIPPNAPFGIVPILDEGSIHQNYFWLLMPYISGVPYAVQQGGV
ncbi:hypothetical protein BVY00_01620, partial [bacterium G20]